VALLIGSVLIAVSTPTASVSAQRDDPMTTEPIAAQLVAAGGVVRIAVPEAFGGKTVIGQLAVDEAREPGFITAYGCANGLPRDTTGRITRADLNYNGSITATWSNRLIVQADGNGDICFYALTPVELIVDVNGVSFDTGISSFPNRRTDTRLATSERAAGAVRGGKTLRLKIDAAIGGKTVIGQLAVTGVRDRGFVTAYPCAAGLPLDSVNAIDRSDLNYSGTVAPTWSNRLVVEADADGAICFFTSATAHLVIDINGVTDAGITTFANRRTDTRTGAGRASIAPIAAGGTLRLRVPEAEGGRIVLGQLAVDNVKVPGFVTAYPCAVGIPVNFAGEIDRSDLNFIGNVARTWSNRLIVEADVNGDICLFSSAAAEMIVDINGVSAIEGITPFPNRRTDTRFGVQPTPEPVPINIDGVPQWPPYVPFPALNGVAALTGLPASAKVAARPIIAMKVDNFRLARPQFGLDQADAVIELNVEGVTRFIALFHSNTPPRLGPARSARTADLDLLAAMNRPIFTYSGANVGVGQWLTAAANSGVLVDFAAQSRPCYFREPTRPGPHNLLLDPTCVLANAPQAGPARPLWSIDATWAPGALPSTADSTFDVDMDGVDVTWTWDARSGRYLRFQDGVPHLAEPDIPITASNVVIIKSKHVPSPVDARSPNPISIGSGQAVVHRDGRAIPGTWSRPSPFDPFTFFDAASGDTIPLDVGVTFVELVRQI
jgi:hypothetical protein